jgi:hypothetical protein
MERNVTFTWNPAHSSENRSESIRNESARILFGSPGQSMRYVAKLTESANGRCGRVGLLRVFQWKPNTFLAYSIQYGRRKFVSRWESSCVLSGGLHVLMWTVYTFIGPSICFSVAFPYFHDSWVIVVQKWEVTPMLKILLSSNYLIQLVQEWPKAH